MRMNGLLSCGCCYLICSKMNSSVNLVSLSASLTNCCGSCSTNLDANCLKSLPLNCSMSLGVNLMSCSCCLVLMNSMSLLLNCCSMSLGASLMSCSCCLASTS